MPIEQLVAVIANVVIWAHHMYLDFPSDSFQAALNTSAQPLTLAIMLPSALSLYSLFFTMHRSRATSSRAPPGCACPHSGRWPSRRR